MELPFKYMVLCIMRELYERNLSLIINKNNLIDYATLLLSKTHFTIDEKKEIGRNFNFEYELSDLVTKYYYYFDIDDERISFDNNYIDELDDLIYEEMEENDIEIIHSIDFAFNENIITFLEILGIKIRKELYDFLMDNEKEIEEAYNELYGLTCYVGMDEVDVSNLINKIKKLYLKKQITLVNTKYSDLIKYASSMVDKTTNIDDVSFLLESKDFSAYDVVYDGFLRCIFTSDHSYSFNLWESLVVNFHDIADDVRYSFIKFYLTFLELLEKEIEKSKELLNMELIFVKYRVMNVLDSVYGTTLFMNNKYDINDKIFRERYNFIVDAVYYFANELLMYDDDMYKDIECNTDNVMVYLNNIIKKLLIEAYYKLTNDKDIVNEIKNNELYEVNVISSNYLKDIVNKPMTRIKDK